MLTRHNRRWSHGNDDGFTMVMAVMITAVVFILGATWVAYANHESSSSSYDRRRQQAIDAANAGLVVTEARLARSSDAAAAASGVTAFAGGSAAFETSVATDSTSLERVITSIGYAPSKTATDRVTRTVRQVVALQPSGFQYAMFSAAAIATGSAGTIIGDVFAAGSISFGNAQHFTGNVFARGSISTGSNQTINGSLYANGSISLSATLNGSAYAGGSISVSGSIRDNAQAGGSIASCTRVGGTCLQATAPPPVPAQTLPAFDITQFTSVQSVASGAAFVSAHSGVDTQGVFSINGSVAFNKNDSLYLKGDTTIIATGAIGLPGSIVNHSTSGANVQLTVVSTGGGTITLANNSSIPATVPTLIYTRGSVSIKNSTSFYGALYAGDLGSGSTFDVTYAPVKGIGFDFSAANPQSFTIRNVSTREIINGT